MSTGDELDRNVRALDKGYLPHTEFLGKVTQFAYQEPGREQDVYDRLVALAEHPNEYVQSAARQAAEMLHRQMTHVTDIAQIRRTSPLRPGVRLRIGGGYTEAYSPPHWLGGRPGVVGTFIDFVDRGAGKMPAALVRLDDAIELPDVAGRYALLTLRYVADWDATETVAVFITDVPPADIAAFAAAPPPNAEVETHASYVIEPPSAGVS